MSEDETETLAKLRGLLDLPYHASLTAARNALPALIDRLEVAEAKVAAYERGVGPDDPRECPAAHGDQCCGYVDACRAALGQNAEQRRVNKAEAKIAAVEALADKWCTSEDRSWISSCGDDLRDVLDGA